MKCRAIAITLMLSACVAPSATLPAASLTQPGNPRQLLQQQGLPTATQDTRTGGRIEDGETLPLPSASFAAARSNAVAPPGGSSAAGDISLDFADTDIRTVVSQILGTILQQNYSIDPAVQGTATLRTIAPLPRDALIPTLQALLAQNNAVLVRDNGIYRVVPAAQAAASASLAGDTALGGAVVVSLHYAQAAPLAQMLQPYVTSTGRIVAASDQNALIVAGDPASRNALVNLIQAFDTDQLAGQSYELFPVSGGDAMDFSAAFAAALNKTGDPGQPGQVRVVPLERMNAVLVIASNETLLSDAQRIYAVLNQVERETLRSWYVYYLHNGRATDAAYILQQAFTPDDVTAAPSPQATGQVSSTFASQSGGATGAALAGAPNPTTPQSTGENGTASASALPGPLSAGGSATSASEIRIIPDNENNALVIYATAAEDVRISAMLDKIDVAPMEVRIDATIAEVDLNNALQYGTQFFFKSGGINTVLSQGSSSALATNFPGFVLSGNGGDAAPLAISLLQSVTKVDVLSSPELLVLDGQPASLQVGALVPYLTQTSQQTLITGSPVINAIDYRETGVVLQVTPHVGSDGLVTLDVSQELSAVQNGVTTQGINSPTFTDRAVTSRVAIQDGQTVGLAGLISDSDSHGRQGIPFLQNVPLLGDLAANQNNARTRTELLVLITPHIIRTQTDANALTEDLRLQMPDAAAAPAILQSTPIGGAADPDQYLRDKLPR